MTKTKLREAYLDWNKEIGKLEEKDKKNFQKLQELCAEKGDGHKWCCWERLVEALVKAGNDEALPLYREHCEIDGKLEALRDLAIKTNNFEIKDRKERKRS